MHYPTDINLLFDAIRKVIELTVFACKEHGLSGWRQSEFNIDQYRKQLYKIQKQKHSSSKDPVKAEKKKREIKEAHTAYTENAIIFLEKAKKSEAELLEIGADPSLFESINHFVRFAEKQIDLIIRRVIKGEIIPHEEKIFSVFQPHTEWISKGKAGVPVELGLRVAVLEDTLGFILHHQVMQKQTDDQIAVPMVQEAKKMYPNLNSCSFDKGFHSLSNQVELKKILEVAALPKKGKLSKIDSEHQQSVAFINAKKKHSAVESAINALEVHGLNRCPDSGLNGFKRYVSLAILARNIQIIGAIITKREQRKLERKRRKLNKEQKRYRKTG